MKEQKKDSENVPPERRFTRAEKKDAEQIYHKSAVTDHKIRQNHIINWEDAKIIESQMKGEAS